jgi:hypothetical protein
MARVVALVPDLMFGSRVVSELSASGHDPVLAMDGEAARRELAGAELLIVDLTDDAEARIDQARRLRSPEVRLMGFYSHVEAEVRERAEAAGFDLVVPRSRMAREGGALASRLLSGAG